MLIFGWFGGAAGPRSQSHDGRRAAAVGGREFARLARLVWRVVSDERVARLGRLEGFAQLVRLVYALVERDVDVDEVLDAIKRLERDRGAI